MRQKIRNNSRFWLALIIFALMPLLVPRAAYAYNFSHPPTIGYETNQYGPEVIACPLQNSSNMQYGLTRRIVPCIKENIISAVSDFLVPFANALASTINAAFLLAIIFWGLMVTSGRMQAPSRDLFILGMKIGAIMMLNANFPALFSALLDAMDDMLGIVGSGAIDVIVQSNNNCPAINDPVSLAVWDAVDCAIDTLVGGVFSAGTLASGIAGFLFACLFSGTVGFFIAVMGFFLIVKLLFIVARALYTFIGAYMGFAILMLIAPLMSPLMLFSPTKPYYEKWLRLFASFILQPIILFAFLSMLLVAFDTVVFSGQTSLYRSIVYDGNQTGISVDTKGFRLGDWLSSSSGAYGEKSLAGKAITVDPGKVMRDLGAPTPLDTQMLGKATERLVQPDAFQEGILDFLGLGEGGTSDLRFFAVDIPVTGIDWVTLAAVNNQPNTTLYIAKLLLSMLMALITAYIFMTMLDFLPYIGSGIAGVPVGMPTLGVNNPGGQNMAPPGSGLMDDLGKQLQSGLRGK